MNATEMWSALIKQYGDGAEWQSCIDMLDGFIKAACEKAYEQGYAAGWEACDREASAAQEGGRSGWIHAGWLEKQQCSTCKDMIFVTESRAAAQERENDIEHHLRSKQTSP